MNHLGFLRLDTQLFQVIDNDVGRHAFAQKAAIVKPNDPGRHV